MPPTAQQVLQRMDRQLVPIHGRLDATLTDWLTEPGGSPVDGAMMVIIQETAAKGWNVVMATPVEACYSEFWALELTMFGFLADGVDTWRTSSPPTQEAVTQLQAGIYLLRSDYAQLVRDQATCEASAPAATPKPTSTPRPSVDPGVDSEQPTAEAT